MFSSKNKANLNVKRLTLDINAPTPSTSKKMYLLTDEYNCFPFVFTCLDTTYFSYQTRMSLNALLSQHFQYLSSDRGSSFVSPAYKTILQLVD